MRTRLLSRSLTSSTTNAISFVVVNVPLSFPLSPSRTFLLLLAQRYELLSGIYFNVRFGSPRGVTRTVDELKED